MDVDPGSGDVTAVAVVLIQAAILTKSQGQKYNVSSLSRFVQRLSLFSEVFINLRFSECVSFLQETIPGHFQVLLEHRLRPIFCH